MKTPLLHITILIVFLLNTLGPLPASAQEFHLPTPGVRVSLSPPVNPAILKGIKVHTDNPFQFDFIMDVGDQGDVRAGSPSPNKDEANRLIKYFLASLTVPERDLWVNLSPYEKDRIVPESFGLTEMGRDLLAEDYMLKQITASLIYPEDEVGKKFWKRIYEEAAKKYNTTNIPVNTFNKVWIVPDKAVVYERQPQPFEAKGESTLAKEGKVEDKSAVAYVVESRLKVMLEADYLAESKNGVGATPRGRPQEGQAQGPAPTDTNILGNNIIREIVIPELTREVNEGANFAKLRQVYNSLILATWYKKKIKDSILSQVYADKNKTAGVEYVGATPRGRPQEGQAQGPAPTDVELIYQRYLQAFKKGVYNYIKEDIDSVTQQPVPRKYFSGGVDMAQITSLANPAISYTSTLPANLTVNQDRAMVVNMKVGVTDTAKKSLKQQYEERLADLIKIDWKDLSKETKEVFQVIGINDGMVEMAKASGRNAADLFVYGLPEVRQTFHTTDQFKEAWNDLVKVVKVAGPYASYLFWYGFSITNEYPDASDQWLLYTKRIVGILKFLNEDQIEFFIEMSKRFNITKKLTQESFSIQNPFDFVSFLLSCSLNKYTKEEVLTKFLEPFVFVYPDQLTSENLSQLVDSLENNKNLRYFLYYVSIGRGVSVEVKELAKKHIKQKNLFKTQEIIAKQLKSGKKKVLAVQNIKDGLGDEIIRMASLMQSFLDYNPNVEITIITNRPYLYDHPRVKTLSVSDVAHLKDLKGKYDVVVNHYDTEKPQSDYIEDMLRSGGIIKEAPILIVTNKTTDDFVYEQLRINGVQYASNLGLSNRRALNVYEATFRLTAELGLPLRSAEEPGSLMRGQAYGPAQKKWRAMMEQVGNVFQNGKFRNPVVLLNPYGWELEAKGFGRKAKEKRELVKIMEQVVSKGYKVVLVPNGKEWGSKTIASSFIQDLPRNIRKNCIVADDPSEDPKSFRSFIEYSDYVLTVEGGMMHRAYSMGKPFGVLLRSDAAAETEPERWIPYGISSRQGVIKDGDDIPIDAAMLTGENFLEEQYNNQLAGVLKIDWSNLPEGTKKVIQLLGVNEELVQMAKSAGPGAGALFIHGLPKVRHLFNTIDEFRAIRGDLVEMTKAAGFNAMDLFNHSFYVESKLCNTPDDFKIVSNGFIKMTKAAGPQAGYLFGFVLPRMWSLYTTPGEFNKVADGLVKMIEAAGPNAKYLLRYGIPAVLLIFNSPDQLKSNWDLLIKVANAAGANVGYIFKYGIAAVRQYSTSEESLLVYTQKVNKVLSFLDEEQVSYFYGLPIGFAITKAMTDGYEVSNRYEFVYFIFTLFMKGTEDDRILTRFLEPFVFTHPEELTAQTLEKLLDYYKERGEFRYFLYYLSNSSRATPDVKSFAQKYIQDNGLFGWRQQQILEQLKLGKKRVLVVHNMEDGLGDELVDVGSLVQSFLDYNPDIEITIFTARPYLYDHPRVKVVEIEDVQKGKKEWYEFQATYDVVIDHYEDEGFKNNDLEKALQASAVETRAFINIRNNKNNDDFVFEKFAIKGYDYAGRLGLNRARTNNVYEPTYRLIAELGLPLRTGEEKRGSNSLSDGVPYLPAQEKWQAMMSLLGNEVQDGKFQSPVVVLNPYGGLKEEKGFSRAPKSQEELIEIITQVVSRGYKIVLLPNGKPWGTKRLADNLINSLPKEIARNCVVADEPAVDPKFFKYFIEYADYVLTAEGGMVHLAYSMGKPFGVLMRFASGGSEWIPYGRSSRQRVIEDVSYALREDFPQRTKVFDSAMTGKFSYTNSANQSIVYDGLTRKVLSQKGEEIDSFDAQDARRNWNVELLELSIQLRDARRKVCEYLRDKYLSMGGASYEFQLGNEDSWTNEYIRRIKDYIQSNFRRTKDSHLEGLERRLKIAEKLFQEIIQYRNHSPEIFQRVALDRDQRKILAIEALGKTKTTQLVNIYVNNQTAGGVLGRAKIIADGIASLAPSAKIKIYVFGETRPHGFQFDNVNSRIEIIGIKYQDEIDKSANVHVGVSQSFNPAFGGIRVKKGDSTFRVFHPTYVQGFKDEEVGYFSLTTNNDLQDPYGTMYLDKGLLERKQQRDQWSADELMKQRILWLSKNLPRSQLSSLNRLSEQEGWRVASSIWTTGYFQDIQNFLEEMDILQQKLSKDETASALPFVEGGQQIVFNLVPGKLRDPRLKIQDLVDRGFTVIRSDGAVFVNSRIKKVPVTVILHDTIRNSQFKTLLSQLNGSVKRNKDNQFFIDFPVYVTGNASWLEAISSGSIFIHDQNDTQVNNKKNMLMSTIIRQLTLEKPDLNWQDLEKEAEQMVNKFLMGEQKDGSQYEDLEERTREARRYSDVMFRFNTIDDIVMDLARRLPAQADSAMNTNKGGIDFNADKINLQIKGNGGELKFNIDPAMLQQLQNAPGFEPLIINIHPLEDLRIFLGAN